MARKEGSARVLGLPGRPESCLCQDPVFGKTEFIERIGGGDIPHGGLIFGGKILSPSASGRSEQSFFACVCEQISAIRPSRTIISMIGAALRRIRSCKIRIESVRFRVPKASARSQASPSQCKVQIALTSAGVGSFPFV